jgi:hypothetical protein
MPEQPSELDRLALGPDAAYSAPQPEPRPPRAPRRHIGEHERGVLADLKAMPDALRKGTLAVTALGLARKLDAGDMTDRDDTGARRELRMHVMQLYDLAPGERKGDSTDELRERRENRMAAAE